MIIIDTNILMEAGNVDIFDELLNFLQYGEPVVLDSSIEELRKIGSRKAKLALELIATRGIEIIKTGEKSFDKAVLKIANPNRDVVVTSDRKLIKALKEKNIKVIRLRQRKYLVEE